MKDPHFSAETFQHREAKCTCFFSKIHEEVVQRVRKERLEDIAGRKDNLIY